MIDPRGPRFAAAVTTFVLALVLVTGSPVLLAAQAVVFALGVAGRSPYGAVFRRVVRPRLGPPLELEDARPVRFAQAVGLAFALVGVLAAAAGVTAVFFLAAAMALSAAFLNAAFGFCLGCEMYLSYKRLTVRNTDATREGAPA